MPLGEKLGTEMPKKLPLWGTLLVAAALGILGKSFVTELLSESFLTV
jgi:hypothetical protein